MKADRIMEEIFEDQQFKQKSNIEFDILSYFSQYNISIPLEDIRKPDKTSFGLEMQHWENMD